MKHIYATTALLLALGVAMPAMAEPPQPHAAGEHFKGKGFEGPLSKLPPEKAALVRESMKKQHEANKDKHEQLRKLHDEQKAIMAAKTFSRDAYLANAKKMEALRAELSAGRATAIADVAAKLTPEERQVLTERPRPPHGMRPPAGDAPPPPPPEQ